jgi:two-component system, sensor histidine kinase
MMGGTIELTSEPGRGSNFRFTARFARQQEADKPTATAPGFAAPTVPPEGVAGTRVLLVEDNPVNLEVAVGILESFGCEVETATNGVEALERYAGREYRLIFMDCQLPDMDGFEATAAIRKQEWGSDRHVPIVALTASAIEGDREQCLAAGMDDYLPKPFTAEQMRAVLANRLSVPQRQPGDRDPDEASPLDPIDTRVLNGLAGLQREGRPDIVNRVVTLFLESAPLLIKELESAVASGDLALLHRASHTLKSASANVGAAQLSARCESLEAAARTGNVTDLRSRVQAIVDTYRLAESALTARLPAVA